MARLLVIAIQAMVFALIAMGHESASARLRDPSLHKLMLGPQMKSRMEEVKRTC